MTLRRSLLYMPGTDWRKIEKAAIEVQADSICMDLEDGVAINRKQEGREMVVRALQTLDFGRSERLVRINSPESGLHIDDLALVLPAQPDGIVIPKVESRAQVQEVDQIIRAAEQRLGFELGAIKLILIVESAKGTIFLDEFYEASPRIVALVFGAEDFASDIGAVRTPENIEVLWARSKVVTYAKSIGLDAIDIVDPNFKVPREFTQQATEGMKLGYTGKQLIHPDQVDLLHSVYTPDEIEISEAQAVVEAYKAHQANGTGAFALDGKMVDLPVVKQAMTVLERAFAAGKLK